MSNEGARLANEAMHRYRLEHANEMIIQRLDELLKRLEILIALVEKREGAKDE